MNVANYYYFLSCFAQYSLHHLDENRVSESEEEEEEGDEEGYEEEEVWNNPEAISVIGKMTCWFAHLLHLSHLECFRFDSHESLI